VGEWNSMRTGPSEAAKDSSSTILGLPSILVPSIRRSARLRQGGTSESETQTLERTAEARMWGRGSANRTETLLTGSAIPPTFLHRFLHSQRLAFVGQTTEKSVSLMRRTFQSQLSSINAFRSWVSSSQVSRFSVCTSWH
jgi:hypothetical protein